MSEHVFHFLRPWWFLAIIPLFFLLWRMSKQVLEQKDWTGIIDEALLPHVLINKTVSQKTWPKFVMGFVGLLAITALAGPVWKQLPQPVFRNDAALVIAVDLSRSMNAADLKPSRLVRARFKIADILKQRKEGQTALLAYAGDAFTVTPLTDDTHTILSQLKALSTDLMPVQGSRADRAMTKASELLKQAGHRKGEILLITDGVDLKRDQQTAKALLKEGYRLMILGIGTNEGAPIPDSQGGFYTDLSGNIVVPALDNTSLRSLANAGGGYYQQYTQQDQDVNNLTSRFDLEPTKREASKSEMKSDQWQEEGVWILLLIIPFAAFAFRKGYLIIVVFLINGLTFSEESLAVDLWLTADQKAKQLLESGEAEQAAEIFQNQQWKGSAQYKAGDYEAALETWKEDQSDTGLYNKGNALAKSGKLEEALETYKSLLEKDQSHEDAQYNYDQVKKALEEQQEQEQKQEGKDQQSEQDKKSEEGGGGEDESGQQSESDDAAENDQQSSADDKKNDQEQDDQSSKRDEDKKDEQEKEGEEEASGKNQDEQNEPAEDDKKGLEQTDEAESMDEESQQAVEAALRAIPDDPGGLLRRKFKYQYQRQATQAEVEEQQW